MAPPLRKPWALRPGGTIGIAAPAAAVDPAKLAAGEERLRKAGFTVVRRPDLLARFDAAAPLTWNDCIPDVRLEPCRPVSPSPVAYPRPGPAR